MPEAIESIQTRQRAELLFHSEEQLGAGASFESDVRLVAGYNAVSFFALSDQPFQIQVFEACTKNGPFVVTHTLTSSPAPGGNQEVCDRVLPCGPFMKIVLTNLGAPQGFLAFCASGIPEP